MFAPGLPFFATLLAAIPAATAQDDRSCNDSIIKIVNQTDIDFYSACATMDDDQFLIAHEFKGPFEMPGVKFLPELIAGYLGPKLTGSDREDDGMTSASLPDVEEIGGRGVLFGYMDHLTNISFPKLKKISGDLVIAGSDGVHNMSLPALTTVGGVLLDGDFDEINLPSLKSVSYLRVSSLGNISCPALGAAFASLTFHPNDLDPYTGFTCWTSEEGNTWNSSDPDHNPSGGGSSPSEKNSAQAMPVANLLFLAVMPLLVALTI